MLSPPKRAPFATLGGIGITTNRVQWVAIAFGLYAAGSWIQALRLRDPVACRLMLGTPSFVALAIGGGVLSFGSYALSAFLFVYAKARFGLGAEAGLTIGAIATVAGGLGTILGGLLADRARRSHPAGRIHVAMLGVSVSATASVVQYSTASLGLFYAANFTALLFLTMWLGPVFATLQAHVLPRMRGSATAIAFLAMNLIGLGLGPYTVGLLSDATGNLRVAILSALIPTPLTLALFAYAARRLPAAEASVMARARAAGEPI